MTSIVTSLAFAARLVGRISGSKAANHYSYSSNEVYTKTIVRVRMPTPLASGQLLDYVLYVLLS